jgi:hypothetical protein
MFMSASTAYAGAGFALRHANPMPNLMRIAMGNADILNLSEDQVKALKAWAVENRPKMAMMIKKVVSEEQMLREEALTTDVDVVKKAETMLETRRKIIEMKTKCRAHLKNTLSEKQYAQVIGIYRSMRPSR